MFYYVLENGVVNVYTAKGVGPVIKTYNFDEAPPGGRLEEGKATSTYLGLQFLEYLSSRSDDRSFYTAGECKQFLSPG